MQPFKRIPKATSSPADYTAPSFLDLIPELRNACYEAIFRRNTPIFVHNANAYHAVAPIRAEHQDFVEYQRALTESDRLFEEEISAGDDFKYDFNQFLSLLLSCRQVYHEAIGILYGCNTFVLTRVGDRCDYSRSSHHVWQEMEYCHLIFPHDWLNGLGAQSEFLAKVNIDVDTLCPSNCDRRLEQYELLPLLSLFWRHATSHCSITFIRTGRQLSAHPRNTDDEKERDRVASALNNIFYALSIEDALQLKRYAPFRCILQSVTIENTLDFAYVRFYDNSRDFFASRQYLYISDNGRRLDWEGEDRQVNLSALPNHILEKIYSHIIPKPAAIILNLDNRRTSGCPMSPFQIDRATRYNGALGWTMTKGIPVTLVATSTHPCTDFPALANLEDLQASPLSHSLGLQFQRRTWTMPRKGRDDPLHHSTLVLNIHPNSPTLLSHVRIDMKHLLSLVGSYDVSPRTTIRIHVAFPTSHGSYEESAEVQLVTLRRQLFLLLSDVLEEWPSHAPRGTINWGTLPTVIMNGHCELLSASYSADPAIPDATVTHRHQRLSKSEIVRRGYVMAARFCQYNHMYPDPAVQEDSIYHLWHNLLYMGWEDWSKKRPES